MKKKDYMCFTAMEYIGNIEEISVSKKTLNEDFPLHWHDFFEIEIIVGGSGTQILNGQEYPLGSGCIYMLSPTDFHEVKTREGIELYNLMFHESMLSEEFLQAISAESGDKIFYFNNSELAEIIAMCDIIEAEYKNNKKYKSEFLRSMLECFLIVILRKLKFSDSPAEKRTEQHIQKAILYTQLHFKENPSLKEAAKTVSLNPNYFSQKFKETTGKTYTEYLTGLKISYAKKILRSSNLSVTEVCFACGFSSLSNFMKVFRERTGISPAMYAKKRAVTK